MADASLHDRAPSAPIPLSLGAELPPFEVGPITRTDIVRYAGAGGDFNPIHHDEPFAVSAGMPSVFAMGMLQGGVVAQRLARWVGPENVMRFALRFTGQVWPGDVLRIAGCVTAVEAIEGGHEATIELTATRQAGDIVIRAVAAARVA